jgi:hypothetical protein
MSVIRHACSSCLFVHMFDACDSALLVSEFTSKLLRGGRLPPRAA